jgi:Pyrimidine dimer DNA glycosylase
MNLFCLHKNAQIAAQYNCDIHTNKIFLEAAMMLAYCFDEDLLKSAPKTQKGDFRTHGKTHKNHPVSKFVYNNMANMIWTLEHAFALEQERLSRGYNPHFSMAFVKWCDANIDRAIVDYGDLTEFATAIKDDKLCRKHPDFNKFGTVHNYRLYYVMDKPFAKWKNGNIPEWYVDMKQECGMM